MDTCAIVESEDTDSLAPLAQRMGEEAFTRRLQLEQSLRERRGQGRGIFALERFFDVYGFIRICLKVCFLWERANRNYFDIQVVRREFELARLPKAFDGFTILQLTDLHADLDPDFSAVLAKTIHGLGYDLVLLTGDYRTCTYGDHSGATTATIQICEHLQAPCYAVLGNHDSLAKVPGMEAAGISFLLNENVVIERDEASIQLIGIDDPNYYRTDDLERALRGVPANACKILMSHSPETVEGAAASGIDLVLSGHTHGGQICLPGGIVVISDRAVPRKYLSGAWRYENVQGYTSRGAGATGLPARLNCPAEVTLHTLRASSQL